MILHESSSLFADAVEGISISTQITEKGRGGSLSPHWHERMEIWYIQEGRITVSCDQDIFEMQPRDVLIVNPGQVHSCRMTKEAVVTDILIFDLTTLLSNRPCDTDRLLRSIASGKLRFQHIVRDNTVVNELVRQIVQCPRREPYSTMRVNGLLLQLISLLAERYVSTNNYAVPRHLQEINGMLEYIHTHLSENLPLERLASYACMSPSYLCRWFKEAVGESPVAYVTTVRINRAHELLSTGRYSVTEACHAVGMSDLNSFNRQFRKRVGRVPSKVKSENKR